MSQRCKAMETSPNWVQFGLDLPMAYDPGTHWEYCGVGFHLLSAILEKATGMTALEFARQNLFAPLGIQDVVWPTDPQGVNLGAGNTRLLPRDMAKIGFLYPAWRGVGWQAGRLPFVGGGSRLKSNTACLAGLIVTDTDGGPA